MAFDRGDRTYYVSHERLRAFRSLVDRGQTALGGGTGDVLAHGSNPLSQTAAESHRINTSLT